MQNLRMCALMSVMITMMLGTLSSHAQETSKSKTPSGLTLSVGQLTPLGLGLLDDQHLNLGTRIGYRTGRMQPYLILDYARLGAEFEEDTYDYDDMTGEETVRWSKSTLSGSLLTVGAGLKYLLTEPKPKRVQTYLTGALFTFIPVVEINDETPDDSIEGSAWGGSLAFGAQYAMHRRFSIGAELGVNYSSASLEIDREKASADLLYLYNMLFLEFIL